MRVCEGTSQEQLLLIHQADTPAVGDHNDCRVFHNFFFLELIASPIS